MIDGLALGVLPEAAAALAFRHPLVGLVHHPLALESGLSPNEADAMRTSERAALAATRHVIVNSPATARLLVDDYAVPGEKITVARPGTDRAARLPSRRDRTISLLSVGSLVPRKGYDVLLAALARIADLPWSLTIVGDRSRDRATAAEVEASIAAPGLASRVTLAGAVSAERLAAFYAQADLFVLASRFEGYGMAFTEAIAHGVPVVGTTAGAIPETVPADAGVLVPPDDVAALALALRRLIGEPEARRRLTDGARAAAAGFPTWAPLGAAVLARSRGRAMTFSAEWLALREPYDGRARNRDVLDGRCGRLRRSLCSLGGRSCLRHRLDRAGDRPAPSGPPDLAARRQRPRPAPAGRRHGTTGRGQRHHHARSTLRATWKRRSTAAVDLVTTSALLDLVSDDWLERFVVETAARRLPVYAALTYDGRASLEPADRLDEAVIGAVNRHQRRDKGFGPALGPAAASAVIARFGAVGYAVVQGDVGLGVRPGRPRNPARGARRLGRRGARTRTICRRDDLPIG